MMVGGKGGGGGGGGVRGVGDWPSTRRPNYVVVTSVSTPVLLIWD